ncbi:MAG: hypothetical protein JNK37_13725 [Verrucomicrobiales bacterium]|nr:hypothetical protein [Verrucomicrobiales bacterium]
MNANPSIDQIQSRLRSNPMTSESARGILPMGSTGNALSGHEWVCSLVWPETGLSPSENPVIGAKSPFSPSENPIIGAKMGFSPNEKPIVGAKTGFSPNEKPLVGAKMGFSPNEKPLVGAKMGFSLSENPVVGAKTGFSPNEKPFVGTKTGFSRFAGMQLAANQRHAKNRLPESAGIEANRHRRQGCGRSQVLAPDAFR